MNKISDFFLTANYLFAISLLFTTTSFSQVNSDSIARPDTSYLQINDSFQKLTGQVLDKKTGKPVPYAGVQLGKTTIGASANQYGIFSIKIPFEMRWDTLWVSSMGYKKLRLIPKGMKSKSLTIHLQQETIDLSMVNIYAEILSAKEIVKKAIKAIPINYYMKDFYETFYIQDLLSINDTVYRNNEYVGNLIHNRKDKRKYSQVFIEARHDSIFYQRPVNHNFLNEFIFEEYFKDPVRSKLKRVQNADIKLDTILLYDGMEIYKISFVNKSNVNNHGFVYINADDFAIVKYENSFNPNANMFVSIEKEDAKRKNIPISDFNNFSHDHLDYKRTFFYYRDIDGLYFLEKINFYLIIKEKDLDKNTNYVTELFKLFFFYDIIKGRMSVPDDYEVSLLNPEIPYNPEFWNNFVAPVGDEVTELDELK